MRMMLFGRWDRWTWAEWSCLGLSKVSEVDSRVFLELVLLVDSCLTVDLCWRVGGGNFAILVMSFMRPLFCRVLLNIEIWMAIYFSFRLSKALSYSVLASLVLGDSNVSIDAGQLKIIYISFKDFCQFSAVSHHFNKNN